MKKLKAAMLGIIGAGVLLTGCGSGTEQIAQEAAAAETIHMAVPYDNPYYETVLTSLAADYMTGHENVTVELEFLPYRDYESALASMAAGGNRIDLVLVDNAYIPMLVQRGFPADIGVWLNQTGLADELAEKMIPIQADSDSLYGCPFLCWTYVLYYNTDLIDSEAAASLTSWEKIRQNSYASLISGRKLFAIAAADNEELTYQFLELLLNEGSTLYTLRVANRSETLEGLSSALDCGALPIECLDWNQTDLTCKFAQGAVATMLNRTTQAPFLRREYPDMNWSVTEMPIGSGKNHIMGIQSLVVAEGASSETLNFLEWLMQKEQVKRVASELNSIPVRVDVALDLENEGAEYLVGGQSLQYGGNFQSWTVISKAMRSGVRSMLMGDKDPNESLSDMQYTINQYYVW